jgi:hypothetical protein
VLIIGECRIKDDEVKDDLTAIVEAERHLGRIDTKKIKSQQKVRTGVD